MAFKKKFADPCPRKQIQTPQLALKIFVKFVQYLIPPYYFEDNLYFCVVIAMRRPQLMLDQSFSPKRLNMEQNAAAMMRDVLDYFIAVMLVV